MNNFIHGYNLMKIEIGSPNNAGLSKRSQTNNTVEVKKIKYQDGFIPYISGQCLRYQLRNILQRHYGWTMSPLIREGQKTVFSQCDPVKYPDDDIFGYMRAKGDTSVTRTSPLTTSAVIAIETVRPVSNFSGAFRAEGDPVPFQVEEYSAYMKHFFSIDLDQVGRFSTSVRSGLRNLIETMVEKYKADNTVSEITDPLHVNAKGEPLSLYELPVNLRKQRVVDVLKSYPILYGGARQSTNKIDMSPLFTSLCISDIGNNPFNHVCSISENHPKIHASEIDNLLSDYSEHIKSDVYVGAKAVINTNLIDTISNNSRVVRSSIKSAYDNLIEKLDDDSLWS